MKSPTLRYLLTAAQMLAMVAFASGARAQSAIDEQIDAYLTELYAADQPGAAVMVVRDGDVVYHRGFGLASVELGVAIEPGMVFRIGSVTKQFTAVAVMMLVEEELIDLDDTIVDHLPDYAAIGQRISIRHLLTHTSGLPELLGIEEWRVHLRDTLTPDDLLGYFEDKPLDFEPGEQWQYSNSGYLVLGRVIEVVTGMSWAQFIRERIIEPLGLEHTGIDDDVTVVPGHVSGYQRVAGELVLPEMMSMSHPWAAGALYSSLDDLATWDAALDTDQLLNQASLEQCFTPAVLTNSDTTSYGFGWFIEQFKGRRIIWHNGRINGFLTHTLRLPKEGLFIAVLSNIEDDGATPVRIVAESVAAIAMGEPFEEVAGIELRPEEEDAYLGIYRLGTGTEPGPELTIIREEGKLYIVLPNGLQDELVPESRTRFAVPVRRSGIDFELDDEGNVLRLLVPGPGEEMIIFTKIT
ncbi:serine hydrolase domain-containing protein [Gemmatimonadota bacterium]